MPWFSRTSLGLVTLASATLASIPVSSCAALHFYTDSSSSGAIKTASVDNPGVFDLADPSGFDRVVAISDVHGMYEAASQLLMAGHIIDANGNWIGGKTLLIIVGDDIDKGPQSLEVIDMWMKLTQQAPATGGEVVHTLGNHETEFLADPTNKKTKALQAELQQDGLTTDNLTDPTQPRGAFLRSEPVAARVGRWLFVHAGLYPDMSWSSFKAEATTVLDQGNYGDPFLSDPNSCMEAKDWWKDAATRQDMESRLAQNGMWGVVQGHQPDAYYMPGVCGSIDDGHLIKIDNGMAPDAGSHPGHLLVFPHPAQMMAMAFPQTLSIANDGTVQALQPVDFASLPPVPSIP